MAVPVGPEGKTGGHRQEVAVWQAAARFAFTLVFLAAVLFVSAGTLDWPMAWAFVAVYMVVTLASRYLMYRYNPGLLRERADYNKHEGVKAWDKRIMPWVAIYGPFIELILAGLNRRFEWHPLLPIGLQIVALVVMLLALAFSTWALVVNRFFSAVVRIQKERGHTTITSGPYRYLRHPGYAAGAVAHLATPLALGAFWALVPAVLLAGLTVLRTALEDRTLRAELPGYQEYSQRVRYRLLPGVW